VVDVIKQQGFDIAAEVWSTIEGANLLTSAKETGALCAEAASVLDRLQPECVLVCADRHEVLAAAQAVAYLHLPLAHIQGGEHSGSIDDKIRDSITALADYHFPCTQLAAFRVYSLTGTCGRIWNYGCSAVDLAKRAQAEPAVTLAELGGAGDAIDLEQPFAVLVQHPVTDEAEQAHAQMADTLSALTLPAVAFWPGEDAGAEGTSKALREAVGRDRGFPLHTVRNLPPSRFLRLLGQCAVLVGNSSAGIRESAYLGVPVVDIGTRQRNRQRAGNVLHVHHDSVEIHSAIERQIAHGRYQSSTLYGDGTAGERIAHVLARCANGEVGSPAGGRQVLEVRIQK
jgi:UDP-hydrolysing UDP-N-acetyl-D-glucosamine 2-epimerase